MAKSYLGPGRTVHLVASIESHDIILLTCVSGSCNWKRTFTTWCVMPQLQILQYTTAYLVSATTQKMAEANELINKMINKMYQNINSIIFSITIYVHGMLSIRICQRKTYAWNCLVNVFINVFDNRRTQTGYSLWHSNCVLCSWTASPLQNTNTTHKDLKCYKPLQDQVL